MEFNAALYGPRVEALFRYSAQGLGGLVASATPSAELKRLIAADLFAESEHPAGALSGLWLYFDCFDEAHTVAQDDPSREGSLWHAIAHRREPDYGNSSYWYRQVGTHPVYPAIFEAALRLNETMPGSKWDPHAFVEFCEEAARSGGEREQLALGLQRLEWEIVFDYCARKRSV